MSQPTLPNDLTYKQETFAQASASGLNDSDAYRQAYDTADMLPNTINRKAYDAAHHGKIAARIVQLREYLIVHCDITPESVAGRFEEHRLKAIELEQMGPANTALERQADLLDLFGKRQLHIDSHVTVDINAAVYAEKSLEELEEALAALRATRALEGEGSVE